MNQTFIHKHKPISGRMKVDIDFLIEIDTLEFESEEKT